MNKFVTGVTNRVALPLLKVQKHSPALLFAGGVVGVVATVVLASRATLKMDDVLEEHEKNMTNVEAAKDLAVSGEAVDYSEKDYQKDKVGVFVKTSLSIAKLYGPAVIVGAVSIAALTGSHVILTNRLTGLSAAYATLDSAFRKYRGRVVEKYGKNTDEEMFFGTETVEVEVEGMDGTKVKKKVKQLLGPNGYSVCFDESNRNWQAYPGMNVMFVRCQQNTANDLLRGRGYIFLNDVYELLGFPRTPAGQLVGWLKREENDPGGDGFVDFGVLEGDNFNGLRFVKGDEKSVWLSFNVDGEIWSQI